MLTLVTVAAIVNSVFAGTILTAAIGGGALFAWDKARGNDTLKRFSWVLPYLDRWGSFRRAHISDGDRASFPMNRGDRETIHRMAHSGQDIVSLGSDINPHFAGTRKFANAQYFQPTGVRPMTIGDASVCKPFTTDKIFGFAPTSFGALSEVATRAISRGAAAAGTIVNIGEGGFDREIHTEGNKVGTCQIIFQMGTDKNSVRNDDSTLNDDRLRELVANNPEIVAIEIKLVQKAIAGEGGHLAAAKMIPRIAALRGRKPGEDCNAPDHHAEITDDESLARFIDRVRKISGLPVGFKTAYSKSEQIDGQFEAFRRLDIYPDFITLDGGDGTGKGPGALVNHMGVPLSVSLPMLLKTRARYKLEDRIRIIAIGRMFTPDKGAEMIAMGADFIMSARGVMTSAGCVGQKECHLGTCKQGIATHNPALTKGFNVVAKGEDIARYAKDYERELVRIAHGTGKADVRDLGPDDVLYMKNDGRNMETMREMHPGLPR